MDKSFHVDVKSKKMYLITKGIFKRFITGKPSHRVDAQGQTSKRKGKKKNYTHISSSKALLHVKKKEKRKKDISQKRFDGSTNGGPPSFRDGKKGQFLSS
ncbi:hypothetical protein D8B26_003341 [Coccidioides posadasii str. Silveira]|uniref:uncharacterized protein n=1 Tax=Coccidioides posadasii (strain RMSCC 757 / Silveira) TaxID=443226 RepID=UPI001BF02DC3|nr:hypothetical protein D8B26_003341 [Coccidioides posadasii str. Silveira]